MRNISYKILAALILSAVAVTVHAQLYDCSAFLQGNHVEVGINWNGAYGTSTAAPAGYHNNVSQVMYNYCDGVYDTAMGLGFVADPDLDGWTVGSPAYFGDYFMPGDPQEGWSVMADGMQADAWNQFAREFSYSSAAVRYDTVWDTYYYASSYDTSYGYWIYSYDTVTSGFDSTWVADTLVIPGYTTDTLGVYYDTIYNVWGGNIAYSNVDGVISSTWEGVFDSIDIVQVTTIDSGALYFNVQVTLTNLASAPKENVYYLRTVDPDNTVEEGGSYVTVNTIEHQLPNADNLTVVSARDSVYAQAYLALGTTDLRAKALMNKYRLDPVVGSLADLYAATDTADYMFSGTETADAGISLVFNIGHLASADTLGAVDSGAKTTALPPNRAVINYTYAFGPGLIEPTRVQNLAAANVQVYPNPFTDMLKVTGLAATDRVVLYDMMGRIMQLGGAVNAGISTFHVNTAPGSYLMQVLDKDGNVKKRVPVQKL